MRKFILSSAFGVAVIALAASGAAAQAGAPASKSAEKTSSKPAVAGHATQGVVKSVDATTLVISKGNKKPDETFTLNASTQREGTIEAGAPVSVHYKQEGKTNIATAVVAKPAKKTAAKK
jgi:hypothetical protein